MTSLVLVLYQGGTLLVRIMMILMISLKLSVMRMVQKLITT